MPMSVNAVGEFTGMDASIQAVPVAVELGVADASALDLSYSLNVGLLFC